MDPPQEHCPILCLCDDKALFSGGVGVNSQTAISNMEAQAAVLRAFAVSNGFHFGIDCNPEESKTLIVATIRDQYGFSHDPNINIWLPAATDFMRVPVASVDQHIKSLGVVRGHFSSQLQKDNEAEARRIIRERSDIFADRVFPGDACLYMLQNKITGGLKWLVTKSPLSWGFLSGVETFETRKLKFALGLPSRSMSAHLQISKHMGGCGYIPVTWHALAERSLLLLLDLVRVSDSQVLCCEGVCSMS